jgi:AraC-like DNA-binding protein
MTKHLLPWEEQPLSKLPAATDLFSALSNLFREAPFYLNPNLRVKQICLRLPTKPKTLLKALKQHSFGSFPHFVNHHRIEEAKKLMAQQAFDIYTLEAIAEKAGFGTRQAFYNAFESFVGMKPACYRRMLKKSAPGVGIIL